MREIIIRRNNENFSKMNYKVVFGNGQTILIGNGATKKVQLDNIPVRAYVKQGWLRSKVVTIDSSTKELVLKNERTKNLTAPWVGGLLALTILLPTIWDAPLIANMMSFVGLCIILMWIIYAFVIKREDWILVDKMTSD